MSILRTPAGAGIALLLIALVIMSVGCSGEPHYTMNLTAPDCAKPDARCYP